MQPRGLFLFQPDIAMPTTAFNGHALHYADSDPAGAQRPVLLFVHAYTCNHSLWDGMVARFSSRFRCLTFDLPGHGQSEPTDKASDMAYLAQCAIAVLDAAGVDKAHMCGLSIGGMIGTHLGFSHSERMASLTLACTTGKLAQEAVDMWDDRLAMVQSRGLWSQVHSSMERWYGQGVIDRFGPDDLDPVARMIASTSVQGAVSCGLAVKAHDVMNRLGAIATPTLVIGGALDLSFSPDHLQRLADAISGAELVMLEGAGHLAPVQTPDAFAKAMTGFYDRIGV